MPDKPENVGGCDFHWKQLLRRKLEEYRIPEGIIQALMTRIEMLTVLLYEDILKGIAYIRAHIDEGSHRPQLDAFWRYFLKTFMKMSTRYDDSSTGLYLFTSWKLSHLLDERGRLKELDEDGYSVLVNRTNNPLERFNRKLNERIPRHPTVQVLVDCLKEICNEYVDTMKDIKYKRYKAPKHLSTYEYLSQSSLLTLLRSRFPSKEFLILFLSRFLRRIEVFFKRQFLAD
jgi:hypothetical protein